MLTRLPASSWLAKPDLPRDACVGRRRPHAGGKAAHLICTAIGEPALAGDLGPGQAAVRLDAQDLAGGLAYQRCAAVDPDHQVVLGQLGDAEALLLAEPYGLHVVSSL